MFKKEAMKNYVHILFIFLCGAICYACRTSRQSSYSSNSSLQLSGTEEIKRERTDDMSSRFSLREEQNQKTWKATINYDTSKPADASTGLPPVSSIEIEGSEKEVKAMLEKEDTIRSQEGEESSSRLEIQDRRLLEKETNTNLSAATGIESGFKYGLIIGIPIVLIIISLYVNRKL